MTQVFAFEDVRTGQVACWYPGRQSAVAFCRENAIRGSGDASSASASSPIRLFAYPDSKLSIYCPFGTDHFLVRTVTIPGYATVPKVLSSIERVVREAIAQEFGSGTPQAQAALWGFITCHMMINRSGGHYKVYVRTPQPART